MSADELFEVARLVVAAEIAKIHTIEWTPQLLYDEPLYTGMNSNWYGLVKGHPLIEKALARVVDKLGKSEKESKATSWYSVFASGPGIIGTGTTKKGWDLTNPDDVNGFLDGPTEGTGLVTFRRSKAVKVIPPIVT